MADELFPDDAVNPENTGLPTPPDPKDANSNAPPPAAELGGAGGSGSVPPGGGAGGPGGGSNVQGPGAAFMIPVNIEDEMRRSYLDYSMSVIIGRALPDVRDGLKPVHRRILYGLSLIHI